jgi:cysteine desulfurase
MKPIYLDHNATTPLDPRVLDAMLPYFRSDFGNPASAHASGRQARRALENARETVSRLLGAEPDEVIFTSGATEANNLALTGLIHPGSGALLASPIEHPSIVEPLGRLARRGVNIRWLPVDEQGKVGEADFAAALDENVRLVTIMLANNETGVIQPVARLAALLARQGAFHCDAVQAVGRVPVSFRELNVTSLSLSAHKFHGPKGIGALLVRRKTKLEPLLWGGHQQGGRRPGTEPVALGVGLAVALELAYAEMSARLEKVLSLRRAFLQALAPAKPWVINGPETDGVAHTLNISFLDCQADALLMNCDLVGIACSTGSACSSGSLLPSPVLQAMKVSPERLHSAMRFSLGHELTLDEITEAGGKIAAIVKRLRARREDE